MKAREQSTSLTSTGGKNQKATLPVARAKNPGSTSTGGKNQKPHLGKPPDSSITNKTLLIMDEVDGMDGNQDRGGMQLLLEKVSFDLHSDPCDLR